ncbi:MAG: ABC transporter permease [Acidobacteriaceae bacterium]|nr:ABC transporter permease [Acidobacteriaceae bacterium]
MDAITFAASLARDLRYGVRMLRRNPVFTAVALLTLAIGIGANTAVFSVVNSVLLKPLNYPHPDQLVALRQLAPGAAGLANFTDGLRLSPSMYFTYAEHNQSFQALGVWISDRANVTRLAEPEQVRVVAVSDGVLQALNVPPALGRWLSSGDQMPQGPERLLLSYGYWQRRFGGSASVIGRTLRVDSRNREIVGVMPRDFRIVNQEFDLLVPLRFNRGKLILAGFGYQGIGRLKPGISIDKANTDLARLLNVWMDSWSNGPGTNPHFYENWKITPAIQPLKNEVLGNVADVLWVVMATVGLLMLIAGANVTNLLLVRAEARQHELAVRTAIGAGWGRIVRELLAESVPLAFFGGALGMLLAQFGLRLLVAIGPGNLPRLNEVALDTRALGFALLLCVFSGLFFGFVPAWKYAGPRSTADLGARTVTFSRERHRARNLLVVAQVAMALVLLVSSGLLIRTFQALRTVDPGFTAARQLQTMRISIPTELIKEPGRVIRTQNDILDKLAAIGGVTAVGFGSEMPMEGYEPDWDEVFRKDSPSTGEVAALRLYKYPSPGFFQTCGTRIMAGRDITWQDIYGHRPVVLISENLAREFWGSAAAALGKQLREFPSMPWHEVIGVVQNVSANGVAQRAPSIVYWPLFTEGAVRSVTFVVRSNRAGTEAFIRQVQQAVWSTNASLPVASVQTMQDIYDRSLSRTSFALVILAIAGAMALLLGVIGIYGVMSYAVSQRRREIGIRVALGAQPDELKRMFVTSALKLALAGAVLGLATAAGLSRLLQSLLFGVSAIDPVTYLGVVATLLIAAALASYLPARRTAAVDPIEALRAE